MHAILGLDHERHVSCGSFKDSPAISVTSGNDHYSFLVRVVYRAAFVIVKRFSVVAWKDVLQDPTTSVGVFTARFRVQLPGGCLGKHGKKLAGRTLSEFVYGQTGCRPDSNMLC